MSALRAWLGLALVLALSPLACQSSQLPPPGTSIVSTGGHFTDENGQAVSLESFRGSPVIVSAMFTSCTVRCPLTVQKLREVDDAFGRTGARVPVVLLTLDPRTDTEERLRRFKVERKLPAHWHLIRGSAFDTQSLARQLRVNAAYDDGHIDHDVRVAILDPQGHVARSFSGWSFDVESAVVR